MLERSGFERLRQEGSHVRLRGPRGELVTVKRTIDVLKPKTLASALRQAGWTVADLRARL
ncbi:MAG: type II toxin-antitoxin system HicA family toxin [Vulcanimicrobiaceae bacterium]